MKVHPAAELLPSPSDEELQELARDIQENGLREPIVTYEGAILDGRSRHAACGSAGVEPSYREYGGDDPFAYSISVNVHRRHLTKGQRDALAAEAMEPLMEEARKRQGGSGRFGSRSKEREPQRKDDRSTRSRERVAQMFGTSHAQVGRAHAVREKDPEIFERIKSGELTVGAATKEVEMKHGTTRKKAKPRIDHHDVRGEKMRDLLRPLVRYLRGYSEASLVGISPTQAGQLLAIVQEIDRSLLEVERALEERAVKSRALS